jgi:hypothetical protein
VSLTEEPGTGRVRIDATRLEGEVSRDDVAAVLAAVLHEPRADRRVLYVAAGNAPIDEALALALGG